jgi:hypothetical protein
MKLHLLLYSAPYEGENLLGIYDSAGKAEQALKDFIEEDGSFIEENYRIVEVSLNDTPDWNFTDPSLRSYYQNLANK